MKKILRDLAREAVIFGLLGLAVGIGVGTWTGYDAPAPPVQSTQLVPAPDVFDVAIATALKQPAVPIDYDTPAHRVGGYEIPPDSANKVAVRLKNGQLVDGPKSNVSALLKDNPGAKIEVWGMNPNHTSATPDVNDVAIAKSTGGLLPGETEVPLTSAAAPVPFDPNAPYSNGPVPAGAPFGPAIPDSHIEYRKAVFNAFGDALLVGLVAGFLYGFPGGFGLWTFYRVVRFAVKG